MIRALTIAVLLTATAAPAFAQSSPGGDWVFEIGAGTDNRSKGASKSDNDPYVFGSAQWHSGNSLFYAGPAVETIKSGGSEVEAEFVVGYQPEAFGYEFDFNIAYKNRLGADASYDDDSIEFSGAVSRAIGPAKAGVEVQYSPDAAGSTEAFTWVEGHVGWAFNDKFDGSVALGRREQDNAPDYTAWNAGVTYALTDAIGLDVRYYDTNAVEFGRQYKDALVAEISYAF